MEARALKGRPVVTIEGGERLGEVSDILFNLDKRAIQALSVGGGGLLGGRGEASVVEMADVRAIGADAVMVQDREVLRGEESEHHYRQFPNFKDLTSLKVVTETGTHMGNVAGVRVDEEDGAIRDLEVAYGGFAGAFKHHVVVPVSMVTTIGRDAVVIPARVLEALERSAAGQEPTEATSGQPITSDEPTDNQPQNDAGQHVGSDTQRQPPR